MNIAQSYIQHKGWRINKSQDERLMAPFIIADSAYIIYEDYIKPLKLKFHYKKAIDNFMRCYSALNKEFFSAFSPEEVDYVVEKMDELHTAIYNDIEFMRISIINHFPQYSLEVRKNIASFTVLLHLTQCARILYGQLFKVSTYDGLMPLRNKNLEGMMSYADDLFDKYTKANAPASKGVDLNDIPDIASTSRDLCRKIMKHLNIGPEPQQ